MACVGSDRTCSGHTGPAHVTSPTPSISGTTPTPADFRYFHFGRHLSVKLHGHHLTGPHVLLKWEKLQSDFLAFTEKIY